MSVTRQLARLARLSDGGPPVVSVYLNTDWRDEHQRERTRVFLRREVRSARAADPAPGVAAALDWVEAEGEALISQARHPEARGVALFAGADGAMREMLPVRTPFEPAFVVAPRPLLRPLATLLAETPETVVAFVDAESAWLTAVSIAGAEPPVRLESDVPGRHRRGGWAQLAQSRYQRHVAEHRGRHLDAVVAALGRLEDEHDAGRIVLAGPAEVVAALRRRLPEPVASRVAAVVPAARHEPPATVVERAMAEVAAGERETVARAVDAVLTEAAKDGRGVASLDGVLEAAQRGAVDQLYLLRGFQVPGRRCSACGGLQPGPTAACRQCGHGTAPVELGEAVVIATIAAGGAVRLLESHAGLARAGGIAARVRFAP